MQGSWGSCLCLLMASAHISTSCMWCCSLWEKQVYFMVCFFWGSTKSLFWANSKKWSRSSRIAVLTSKSPLISPPICPTFYYYPSSSPLLPFSPVLRSVQTNLNKHWEWCMDCKYMFLCWLWAIGSKFISLNSYNFK